MAGLFIAFEGGEGAGKTTQAALLRERLEDLSLPCGLFREPGGTELGEYLRSYLKSERPLSPEAELLLFEAARVELVGDRIIPALESGKIVIADRFSGSTVAYQGHGRGIDSEAIASLNDFATRGIRPNLTFLLDLPPEEGLRRTTEHQMAFSLDPAGGLAPLNRTEEGTRFEDLDLEFHRRAREGFLEQAGAEPEHWWVIDAGQPVDSVRREVWRLVEPHLAPILASRGSAPEAEPPQGELWPPEA